MLPIPLVPVMPMLSRVDAKKQLGISKGDVVLLTIASGYKYTPIGEIDFANVLAPVLRQHKNALLLVVGPNINSYWQKALGQTGLRIRVEGPQENTAIYYQAADIYLDSFPFASLTSMLEAGSHGVPLISYCPHREVSPVMCTDDLGLDENLVRVTSPQGFQDAMSNLIQDSDLRLHLGQRIRKSIEAEHMGEGWAKRLSSIYRDATHEPIISEPLCVIDQKFSEPLDTWLAALNIEAGMCRDIDSLILEHGGLLPFGPRVRLLAKTLGETRRLYLRLLLSDYMRTRIRKAIKF